MPLLPIIGTVKHVDGTPWANGKLEITLVEPFVTSLEVYLTETLTVILDTDGKFFIYLGVPETGTAHYAVLFPDERVKHVFLAAGPGIDLQTTLSLPGSSVSQDVIQTIIDAANTAVVRTVTQATQIVTGDQIILANGTFAVTLPPATGTLRAYAVKNIGTGIITVTRTGSDTIDGMVTVALSPLDRCSVLDVEPRAWVVL
jgi:hypothetical protein